MRIPSSENNNHCSFIFYGCFVIQHLPEFDMKRRSCKKTAENTVQKKLRKTLYKSMTIRHLWELHEASIQKTLNQIDLTKVIYTMTSNRRIKWKFSKGFTI